MSAGITDRFTNASNGTRPSPTTLTAIRAVAASSISCGALTGWPTATAVHFIIYTTDTSGNKVSGSQLDCKGIVSGTTITNIVYKAGNDTGNAIGAIVEAAPTAAWADDVVAGLTTSHNQDGTMITDLPLTTPKITTGIKDSSGNNIFPTLGSSSATSVKLSTTTVGPTYVESGCVWSGDAYASTKAASMTAGVVYINGVRLTVAAVTARTFTASKDVYVDFTNNGDGTALVTYIDNTTNAASPALTTAGATLRNAIIVVGATNIAAVGSVNQGQETALLPIASSLPYAVTDSLGNMICNRNSNPILIGYRQITSNVTATILTQIAGLVMPVIVPLGRKVKITLFIPYVSTSAGGATVFSSLFDGTIAGTQLNTWNTTSDPVNNQYGVHCEAIVTPTVASKTYSAGLQTNGGTATAFCGSTFPAWIKAELA